MLEDSLKVQRNVQHQREVLASMLVHDLRNPLTAVSLLVASIAPDDESRVVVEDIQCEIDRMRRMLTDVLDVCLASMGELRLRRVEFPIQRLAREVARRMTPIACSRGQSIALELPHEPIMVHADPQLIERVLENLLGNAMHHGPRAQTITLAIHAIQGERVRAEVRDAGDALPASKRGLVFEPFESLDAAQAGGGHGLGLAFCRLAIEAHAGNIDVQPNADKGNCFFFEIPIHQR
jgi:signal transduction histidine kinase